jgi:hypothetical protein
MARPSSLGWSRISSGQQGSHRMAWFDWARYGSAVIAWLDWAQLGMARPSRLGYLG